MRTELNELNIKLDGQVETFYYNSQKYNGTVFENFNDCIVSEFEIKNGVKMELKKYILRMEMRKVFQNTKMVYYTV